MESIGERIADLKQPQPLVEERAFIDNNRCTPRDDLERDDPKAVHVRYEADIPQVGVRVSAERRSDH